MRTVHSPYHSTSKLLPLALLFCWPFLSQAQTPRQNRVAFQSPTLPRGTDSSLWERGVKRVRPVALDRTLFDRVAAKRAMSASAQGLRDLPAVDMNFFADTAITVRWRSVTQTDDFKSFVWTGVVEGYPLGDAIFIVSDSMVTGNVTRGDGLVYELRPAADGGQWVIEMDQRQLPAELPPLPTPPEPEDASAAVPPRDVAAADDGSTIDVMVVYSPAVTAKAGGAQAAQQLVQLGVAETNRGYQNSGVIQRVRLVYSGEVPYVETGTFSTDLTRLKTTDDGYLDGVHALRDTYSADLVSLWVEGGDACGLGYLLSDPTRPRPDLGFSVVSRSCATGYYSFGHEMGHNMGASHARDDGTGPGAYPYSYGFKNIAGSNSFRTVMAYDNNCSCTRVLYWSNPGVQYNGRPVGKDQTASDSAANFLTLNNTRNLIANYRSAAPPPSGGSSSLPESDHPYANNTDKTWSFTQPGNPSSINVTFDSRTSVEPGYDFLYISDGNGNQIPGSPFSGGALGGRTVTVPGATIKIRLVSDDSDVDYGYKVTSITGNTGSGGQGARLVVTAFTTATTGAIGSSVGGASVTVANQGTTAAGAFRIGFYYSRSRSVTTSDIFSGTICSPTGLAAGGTAYSCSGSITVPSTLTPGIWYLAAIADDQNQVQQTDRSGNIRVSDSGTINLTGGTPADLLSPAPGSILTASTVQFQWSAGTGVSKYTLAIGTSPSGTDVYNRDQGTNTSVTISGLPTNGATLYITLSSLIGSSTRSNSYTVKAATIGSGSSLAKLVITSFSAPNSGSVGVNLTGTSLAIANQGSGATGPFRIGYYYSRDPNVTTSSVYSGWSCSFAEGLPPGTSGTCSGDIGVPTTLTSGTWYLGAIADDEKKVPQSDTGGNIRVSDSGTISIAGRAPADLISPTPGATLTSTSVTFRWNSGSGAQGFTLMVGTFAGGGDIYNQDQGSNLSATVSGLPSNGRTLYVRLSSRFGGDTLYNDYTYRAVNSNANGTAPILAITSFTAPTSGIVGINLTGTRITLVNRGNANAPPFRVGFYFGQSSNVTVKDVFSGWACTLTQGLAAGATYTCAGDIGVPTSLAPGSWYVAAIADDQNRVQQSNSSASTHVNDNGPVTLAPSGTGTGGPLPESDHPYADNTDKTWSYVVGGSPSAIRVVFDSRTSVEQDYDYIYIYDGAGNQVDGSPFTGTDLAGAAIVVNGSAVRIELVSDDSVDDYGFKVIAIDDAKKFPLLVLTSFTAPTKGVIGGSLSVSMTVKNLGDAFAAPFRTGFYYSANSNPGDNDYIYSRTYCSTRNGLAPGASYSCSGDIGIPSSLTPGTWYLSAIADDDAVVDQSDYAGNFRLSDNGPIVLTAASGDAGAIAPETGVSAMATTEVDDTGQRRRGLRKSRSFPVTRRVKTKPD
jgi:hypothetical protein